MSLPTVNTAMDAFYARAILGIKENATKKEIEKKYRSLARSHHPDKLLGLSDLEKAPYVELFTMYYNAYEFLTKTNDDDSDNNDRQATSPQVASPEHAKQQQQQQQQQQYAQHFQYGQWTVNGRNLQEFFASFASTQKWEFHNDRIQRKHQREEDLKLRVNVQVQREQQPRTPVEDHKPVLAEEDDEEVLPFKKEVVETLSVMTSWKRLQMTM